MVVLAGCAAVGPDYLAPRVDAPSAWHRVDSPAPTSTGEQAQDLARWWTHFADPVLADLVERALIASPDVRTAQARLREARARRSLAGTELYPSATAAASVSRSRGSRETGGGKRVELYEAGFDAAWEPDIFGGSRRGVEAAQADLEQALASLEATRVSLAAEIALNYVDVRGYQARLDIARRNLASQAQTLQLTRWRAQAGLVGALDVEQARTVTEQTRALIPLLETGLAQAQDRIATLLGATPHLLGPELVAPGPIPSAQARVAVGIPAETLRRRPDVRAAERRVAAETARIGQVEAARYPAFRLSGSIGLEALSLGALGGSAALARSLAAGVSGVLFDAGRSRHQVEVQAAVREQALAAYESAVLTALQEVEDALVALSNSRERETALAAAAEAARNAALYALQRYSSGLIDFQVVLDTQRSVLTVEESGALAAADSAAALIRLYKALGGGWSMSGADASVGALPAR
ncbi:MAG: efflux transporter outer membrane subunit [Burkholderiales bacterium]|nr:efflux transporter outer membrane subunit [Burkholderiales bacterium]